MEHEKLHLTCAMCLGDFVSSMPAKFCTVRCADEFTEATKWMPVDEFKAASQSGLCVIKYKGRSLAAYYDTSVLGGVFLYSKGSKGCYMTECITGVMQAVGKPSPSYLGDILRTEMQNAPAMSNQEDDYNAGSIHTLHRVSILADQHFARLEQELEEKSRALHTLAEYNAELKEQIESMAEEVH